MKYYLFRYPEKDSGTTPGELSPWRTTDTGTMVMLHCECGVDGQPCSLSMSVPLYELQQGVTQLQVGSPRGNWLIDKFEYKGYFLLTTFSKHAFL